MRFSEGAAALRSMPRRDEWQRAGCHALAIAAALLGLGRPIRAVAAADELTPVRAFREFTRKTAPELPESIVTDLLQDRTGVLWIATVGGIASYDGVALRAVVDPLAPRGGWVVLVRRARGGLYAGSRRGVHVFDGSRWTRLATSQPVESLFEVEDGVVLSVFGGQLWQTRALAPAPVWTPVALPAEAGEPLTVFSDRHAGYFVIGKQRYLHCRSGNCEVLATPAHTRTTALLATRKGALWSATWDGHLQVLEAGAQRWTPVDLGGWPSGGIRSLAEDRRGRVWAGGMARLCHDGEAARWQCWGIENGLPDSAVLTLLADREGTLWIGTNGSGLLQWVGESWSHRRQWPGIAAAGGFDVTGVAATHDGGFLASVFGKGVLFWDAGRIAAWGLRDGIDEDIRAVVEPRTGVVWAAGRHGIFERLPHQRFTRTLSLASGFANGFSQAPGGDWYAVTEEHGIYRHADGWIPAPELNALVAGQTVSSLLFTRAGELWIGADTSLVVRRADASVLRLPLGLERGLPESAGALLEATAGQIWVGGSGGIAIIEPSGRRLLREADGVPGNVYFLRASPDGAIWVGGSKGISRYRAGRFDTWDTTNGLLSGECNRGALVLPDGSLLAATSGSLARFDARLAPLPAPALTVVWNGLPPQDPGGVLRLLPQERRLVLGWSAPWLAPQPIEYRTRIGAQAAWSAPTRNSQIVIDGLAAGTHAVAVQARLIGTGERAWTPPLTLQIEATPWWWETAAARVGAALVAAALMLLAVRLHVRRLHARRERELVHARSDFMASASHELRTPIAQIRLFADTLRLGRVRDEKERLHALDTIHRATLRLEALAGNLLQLARGQAGPPAWVAQWARVTDVVQAATSDLAPSAAVQQATIQIAVEPVLHAYLDVEGTRQLLANLLDNAIKYSPPGQVVRIGAEATDGGLRLWVADQGPGIPRAAREQVWQRFARLDRDRNSARSGTGIGLAVVREMAQRAGGGAWIEDGVRGGTRVVVLLPQPTAVAGEAEDIAMPVAPR